MAFAEGKYVELFTFYYYFINLDKHFKIFRFFSFVVVDFFHVQWDEPASIARPERVSPWEIEPFVPSVPSSLVQSVLTKNKRPRQPIEIPVLGERNLSYVLFFSQLDQHALEFPLFLAFYVPLCCRSCIFNCISCLESCP